MKNSFIVQWAFYVFLLSFVISATSCKALKKSTDKADAPPKKMTADYLLNQLEKQQLDAEWFTAKMKIQVEGATGNIPDIKADIRMKKDSVIWASVYPAAFKVELGRLLIRPDSVFVLNKFNKQYYAEEVDYLKSLIDYDLNFQTLQNVILGNLVTDYRKADYFVEGDQYGLHLEQKPMMSDTYIDSESLYIEKIELNDDKSDQKLRIELSDYVTLGNKPFSQERLVTVEGDNNMTGRINFSNVIINTPKAMPFKISDKYEQVRP